MNDKLLKLKLLEEQAAICTSCCLHENRVKSVFGRGNPNAKIVFCGEAPGLSESLQGLPFVGRAGKLLNSMIAAMGLNQDDVYILNTVKCHPPKNRKPTPEEMNACKPFLIQQLDLIKPEVIVALGASATEDLLGPGPGISKRRGNWGLYNNIKTMPTYHPAALLYNPSLKEITREDLVEVLKYIRTKCSDSI